MADLCTRIREGAVALTLLGLLTTACSGKAPSPASQASAANSASKGAPISESSTDEYDYDDPCSLLEPAEVEAVLGAKLATPPFRSSGDPDSPTTDGDDCIYETANFQFISMSVEFTGGAQAYGIMTFTKKLLSGAPGQLKQAVKLDNGTELTGEWDEATLIPMNCCDFVALRGDQLVEIDFTATDATLPQAGKLVDAAFKRIDHPLKIDGGANVDSAAAFSKTRPHPVDPCSLVSRAEAEALIGKLIADPVANGTDECDYELPPKGIRQVYGLQISWRGGYAEWRSNAHIADIAADALKGKVIKVQHDTVYTQVVRLDLNHAVPDSGAWERTGIAGMDFVAIKKDILVKMDLRAIDGDKARKLVEAAIAKM